MNSVISFLLLVVSIALWLFLAYLLGYDRGEYDTKQEVCEVYEEWCVD